MSYPFVPSYYDYGPRGSGTIPVRGITVHMAEGGGTVGYLAKANPNRVSVHYVIEYSGRIVQMLREDHVNGTINPRDIRTTDDDPYIYRGEVITYGATAAKRALGIWWDDPNRATIGIEIEGFAKDGPNAKQADALVVLCADIRSRHPDADNLGHRDFADYKACPGHRIDWPRLGGHGTPSEGEDMGAIKWRPQDSGQGIGQLVVAPTRGLVNLRTGKIQVPVDPSRTSFGRVLLDEPFRDGDGWQEGYLVSLEAEAHVAFDAVVESFTPAETAPPPEEPITPLDAGLYRVS